MAVSGAPQLRRIGLTSHCDLPTSQVANLRCATQLRPVALDEHSGGSEATCVGTWADWLPDRTRWFGSMSIQVGPAVVTGPTCRIGLL